MRISLTGGKKDGKTELRKIRNVQFIVSNRKTKKYMTSDSVKDELRSKC